MKTFPAHSWHVCSLEVSCPKRPRGGAVLVLARSCPSVPALQMFTTVLCLFCCSVPPPSASSKIFKFVIKATVFGLMGYGCYRIGQRTVQFILSMPAAQSYLQKLTEIRSQHWTWVEAQREESGWKGRWRQQRWTGLKEEGNEDSTQRRWVRSKAELLYNKRFDTELTPAMIWWVSLIPGALHETTWFQIEANVTRT